MCSRANSSKHPTCTPPSTVMASPASIAGMSSAAKCKDTNEDILRGYHISLGGHVSLLVPNLPRQVAQRRSPACGSQGQALWLPRRRRRSDHPQKLFAGPSTDLLQVFARARRPAHERILAAVQISRHAAAPPLAVVGHEYTRKGRWPRLRRLRSHGREIKRRR